ncbi:hypothetical protein LWI28_008930 [Acer negundo]|uniref:Uncharacterized protein n=1 Tax=Acer negundo TaxID=4023 RepID=A0AAD5ILT0_ACENE|nr:hypothetical protein LWI28_008930 [Acer negundo]KAK4842077.1 hypothetical protein QYF36_015392 [Acer negundo]
MQLSFANKVTAIPQFLSFKAAKEDRQRKIVNDTQVSSGFMSTSTADAFDSNQKSYYGMIQSAAGPSCSNDIARVKPIGVLPSSNNQPESLPKQLALWELLLQL